MYLLLTATYFLFMGQRNLLAHVANDYLLYILQCFFIILFYIKLWGEKSFRPLWKSLQNSSNAIPAIFIAELTQQLIAPDSMAQKSSCSKKTSSYLDFNENIN